MSRQSRTASGDRGFTLIEMVVSMAIMLVVTGAVFQMAASGQSGFRTQPEMADMQQRLRVAADMIYRDLLMAGAGMDRGAAPGPLTNYIPAVRPARRGAVSPDGDLTFADDRIAIVYVPQTRSQTTLQNDMAGVGDALAVNTAAAGCPAGGPCGFIAGMRAVVFDMTSVGAGYDTFTVTGTSATTVAHTSPNPNFSKAYPKTVSAVSEIEEHVYYYDAANRRLMHYNAHQDDDPLVDHVAALSFTYYADPDPNSAPKPPAGMANCVYKAGTPPKPELKDLGGSALKALSAQDLRDGPTCGLAPNRFDGDLLRVRKIRVSLRVEAARDDLRASSTTYAKSGVRLVPDYSLSFEVSPRNLNLTR